MKGMSPVLAGVLCLLGAAGLLVLDGQALSEPRLRQASQWLLRQELGDQVTVEFGETLLEEATSPPPSPSPSPSPAGVPVPVETVEEAWDERARQQEELAEPAPTEAPASAQGDAPALELRNGTDYDVDLTALPALPQGLDLKADGPVVLIVHTHTTESYLGPGEDPTEAVYRSRDPEEGVMAVGDAMAQVLEERGYRTLHDKTFCDYPEYNGAYSRSRTVIQAALAENPTVCLVLDVHRDAASDGQGGQIRLVSGDAAQVMLVVGTDQGGLEHPDWRQNLSLAALVQQAAGRRSPGLMRPINLRSERFNQDLGPLGLLVEVGASGNSLEEALAGARLFSQGLADVLDQYSGNNP